MTPLQNGGIKMADVHVGLLFKNGGLTLTIW
jgi:hypothetical protein